MGTLRASLSPHRRRQVHLLWALFAVLGPGYLVGGQPITFDKRVGLGQSLISDVL